MRRWIVRLTLGLAALGATLLGMAPAIAGPGAGLDCTGFSCPQMRGFEVPGAVPPGGTATLHYQWNAVSDTSVHPITFQTHDDPSLTPSPASVRLDGAPVPAAAVTTSGPDLTIDLVAAQANPLAAHNLTFTATTAATMPQRAVSWAELAITHGSDTGRSTSDDIVIHRLVAGQPDFFLVAGQENGGQGLTLLRGHTQALTVEVDNRGTAGPAVLTITLPATPPVSFVRLHSGATTFQCTTSGSTIRCPIGSVSRPTVLRADITVPTTATVGQRGTVEFSVAPASGQDADPTDNAAPARVIVGSTADLYASASPSRVAVPPGGTAQITIRVRNQGPNASSANQSLRLWIPPDTAHNFAFARYSTSDGVIVPDGPAFLLWSPGRLAVGQVATATVTIRAVASEPANFRIEGAYRPVACTPNEEESSCANVIVPLTVTTAAPPGTLGPATHGSTGGSGLADTGSSALALGTAAGGLAAAGLLLALAGRRRRPDR